MDVRGRRLRHVRRDLHTDPLPHLESSWLHWPASLRPDDVTVPPEAEALQATLIEELLGADALLAGAPLYNYSLPSSLKAWIDNIHVPGITAPFGSAPQPLAGRPAVIVTSRGGVYDAGSPQDGWDHGVPPLELILGDTLGMDVEVIATSRTLADFLPVLADERERAHEEFSAAVDAARVAARRLTAG
jgi:FMN-dependent NADH-azoreductase